FSECSSELEPRGDCHLLKYNMRTHDLYRFIFPNKYIYRHAKYSVSGNYIVLDRRPRPAEQTLASHQRAANLGEIVFMRSDGIDFKVLPLEKGRNLGPIMSKDETKIAFWRRKQWKNERYLGDWSSGEIYEYDLSRNKVSLFAGPFNFINGNMSSYLSSDEILLQTYTKHPLNDRREYGASEVFKFRRNIKEFPKPSFMDIQSARIPSVDMNGNIYLSGQEKNGVSYFRISVNNEKTFWKIPRDIISMPVIEATPDGKNIIFIYFAYIVENSKKERAFGYFNIESSKWFHLDIPPLASSIAITVKQIQ
ncbi:MAG: hypothetical protein HQM04_18245, partial [Magnetococcales bacterium]|nr:hypothetical protein [Magnetococcales bacterium]